MEHNNGLDGAVRAARGRLLASLAGLVMLTLATASFVRLPGRTLLVGFLGSEVSYRFSGAAQYTLLLIGMVCSGLASIVRAGGKRQAGGLLTAAMLWGLPLYIALSGLLLLDTLAWWGFQIGLAALAGLMIALVVTLQLRSAEQPLGPARLLLNGITYVMALLLFAAIYNARLRSLLSATAILTTAMLLSAELFRDSDSPSWRIWLWSGLVGLLLSELTWAMNYTRLNTRAGAVLLLTAFYVLTGMVQQHLWQRLDRRAVIEFGVALAGGLLVVVLLS